MEFKEIIKSLSGHELKPSEINRIAKEAEGSFDLSPEASDELKMLLVTTSKKYQNYVFLSAHRQNELKKG